LNLHNHVDDEQVVRHFVALSSVRRTRNCCVGQNQKDCTVPASDGSTEIEENYQRLENEVKRDHSKKMQRIGRG
jgi:hypothetical protein